MPGKNVVKIYKQNSFYHIYNRGVEKRQIFLNKRDYETFLKQLKVSSIKTKASILCFCLMTNHFHILVGQKEPRAIEKLMRSLITKYVLYFNYKYSRVGRLFQSTYKARLIGSEEDLLNTSAYIHNNPRKDNPKINLENYLYSSFPEYMSKNVNTWLSVEQIKMHFLVENYKSYVDRMGNFEDDLRLS